MRVFVWCLKKEGGPGGNFSFSSPKQWGFIRFRVQERLRNRKTVAGWEIEEFFKKLCVWQKIRRSTKCKTVSCVSERRMNLTCLKSTWGVWSGCLRRDFGKTLLRYLCTKAQGTSLWPKLQLWHQSVSASVVNPTAFLPLYTSQCTSGDDACAFATQIPSTNRSLRFTGVGRLCGATSTRCTRFVLSYVTVRGWRLWRRNVLNLSSPILHVREISFLVSHATCPPFPYTYLLDSWRARPAQSENIAIDNPIDSGRMDKDAVTIVRFAFSTQVISFR